MQYWPQHSVKHPAHARHHQPVLLPWIIAGAWRNHLLGHRKQLHPPDSRQRPPTNSRDKRTWLRHRRSHRRSRHRRNVCQHSLNCCHLAARLRNLRPQHLLLHLCPAHHRSSTHKHLLCHSPLHRCLSLHAHPWRKPQLAILHRPCHHAHRHIPRLSKSGRVAPTFSTSIFLPFYASKSV